MERSLYPREITVLITICLVWGFHFVVIKMAVEAIPPLFYAALRMTLVAMCMLPFLRWRRGQMLKILGAGLGLGGLNYAFMFTGIAYGDAASAALALELYVPFATMLAVIFLGDHVGAKRLTGIVMAFGGAVLIAIGDGPTTLNIGVLLASVAALAEAIGATFVKKVTGFTPLQLLAWFAIIGSCVLWPATFLFEAGQWRALQAADPVLLVGAILYSAIGASMIGHTGYYWLLQRLPLSVVAPVGLLATLSGVLFAMAFLKEVLSPIQWMGAFFIIVGVGVILIRNNQRSVQTGIETHKSTYKNQRDI